MLRWYKLIKWVKQQKKEGFNSFKIITSGSVFVIWNPENDETLRIKY